MKTTYKILSYIFKMYAMSIVLCIAFLFNRYSIEINHIETSKVGMDTWLITLIPNSIVFEVEKTFVHVHIMRFSKR